MYIPEEKIDEIRSVADLVDVVGDYVRLKRRGSNFVGLCPFHDEKTPSFNVNPERAIYKCFGCGEGGNVFQFVMAMERIGFPEAVRLLAERTGVELPEEKKPEQSTEREAIFHALRFAARYFYRLLTQEEAGSPGLDYFRERGFSNEIIKKFGLGYATDAWDGLMQAATKKQINIETLEKAGLIIPRREKKGYYDRYRGRIIFPIWSHVGKVLGFGGRILKPAENIPKYINSPETAVYHKSRVLYGLHQSKQAIRKQQEALLVEGYTDVLSLYQHGIENIVATSGTALTPEQIKLLMRYTRQAVLVFDADSAGAGAAIRGIDLMLEQGMTVYGLSLPEGEDPDSFLREKGASGFQDFLAKERKDFIAFKYGLAKKTGQLDTPEGQAEAMMGIVSSIHFIKDPLLQESYIRRASDVLDVPDLKLYQALSNLDKQKKRKRRTPDLPARSPVPEDERPVITRPSVSPVKEALPEEKLLIRLMLEHGTPMVELILGNMAVAEFSEGPSRKIIETFLAMYEKGEMKAHSFIDGKWGEDVRQLAAEVLVLQHEPSENWGKKQNINVPRFNQNPRESAIGAMTQLKLDRVREAIQQMKEKIRQSSKQNEDIDELQRQMMHLHDLKKQISQQEFLNWHKT